MNTNALKRLIKLGEIATPSYVYDESVLSAHVDNILEIVGDRVNLCYAMKANPFVVKYMSDRVGKIEVCSPGELEICRHYKIPGENIIFSGVNKTAKDVRTAIEYGVDVITLESVKHFNIVKNYSDKYEVAVKVMPRLSSGAQFGMSEDELIELVRHRDEYPKLDIVGIHYFTGTQKKQIEKDILEMEKIDELIHRLEEDCGFVTKVFEYGLGLAVPYFDGEDFEHVYDNLKTLVEYVKQKDSSYRVTFELGRYFVYSCMDYLTAIDDIKSVDDMNICLVDGGIHHLNYYGQNMAMRVPLIDVIVMDANVEANVGEIDMDNPEWKVCGSLCTFADVLVRKANLGRINLGDVLVFHNAGAYSMTESPALFLSRTMPAIYKIVGDGVEVIRPHIESYNNNIQG